MESNSHLPVKYRRLPQSSGSVERGANPTSKEGKQHYYEAIAYRFGCGGHEQSWKDVVEKLNAAFQKGCLEAASDLGDLYAYRMDDCLQPKLCGIEQDLSKAFEMYDRVKSGSTVRKKIRWLLYDGKNSEGEIKRLIELAERKGDPEATLFKTVLSTRFMGLGKHILPSANLEDAIKTVSPLAERGYPEAQYVKSQLVDSNRLLFNHNKIDWLKRANSQGLELAREELLKMKVPLRSEKSEKLPQMQKIEQLIQTDLDSSAFIEAIKNSPISVDFENIELNPAAQFDLGVVYEFGINIPKNSMKSLIWYQKSSLGGNDKAMYRLALTLIRNHNIPQIDGKYDIARFWLKKASNSLLEARLAYYCLFQKKDLVPRVFIPWLDFSVNDASPDEVYDSLKILAENNSPVARVFLAEILIERKEYSFAIEQLNHALEEGSLEAKLVLAYMNSGGFGFQASWDEGKKLLLEAKNKGLSCESDFVYEADPAFNYGVKMGEQCGVLCCLPLRCFCDMLLGCADGAAG